MNPTASREAIRGGEFLIRKTPAQDTFSPEDFSEEQEMMLQACHEFTAQEITPNVERMDSLEEGFMDGLLTKAGEMGLLSVTVPEEYGGLGMSFNTSMLIAEGLGGTGSFSTAHGAHTGIGTLPIQYYGNAEQKAKYLPKLASGEWKACYCLTEPDAGSDANSGKTKAVLNEAGTHYLITGQKMWISNAGFAQVMIVFAKIDDDKTLSAFIVERDYPGITMNDEEKKLGIKGSSTRQVFFNETPVPVENMLYDRGRGFKIAVNILNIGRIKLGVGCVGGAKSVAATAVNYANERKQFGTAISNFGAIKHKLGNMAIRTYASESANYRAGQDIEDRVNANIAAGMSKEEAQLKGLEEFAIECAIMKVHSSEVLAYVVDEGLQTYGGMGFSADAPMERAYRDARICRIYEGTNEINRMLIVDMLLKRAMGGRLEIFPAAMAVGKALMSGGGAEEASGDEALAAEAATVENLKKAVLMVLGKAAQDIGSALKEEQEVLMAIADMVIETYIAESTLLRTQKLIERQGVEAVASQISMTKVYVYEAAEKVLQAGKEGLLAFAGEAEIGMILKSLRYLCKAPLVNTRSLRREVASVMIEQNSYAF
ncbi:MAG: acyl-CoA dehydrogenase family protein [Bacteroidota bacterium]